MVATGEIVQGVVVAVAVVGAAVVYFDRLSHLSHDIRSMSESIDNIEEQALGVDLQEMEKSITKVEYAITQNNEQQGVHGGKNTVYHTLSRTGIEVAISYGTTHYDGEEDALMRDEWDVATVVDLEFNEQINSMALADELSTDEEITEFDKEKFGAEVGMTSQTPYEVRLYIPTEDLDKIADWLPTFLDRIDFHLDNIRDKTDEFDRKIGNNLEGASY